MPQLNLSSHPDFDWIFSIAGVDRISDGDSYWLWIDTGFRRVSLENFRLMGYDTPELFSSLASEFEKEKAREAKARVITWFREHMADGNSMWLRSYKDSDKYGRWLADIWIGTPSRVDESIGVFLEDLELAVASPDGRVKWRHVYEPEG